MPRRPTPKGHNEGHAHPIYAERCETYPVMNPFVALMVPSPARQELQKAWQSMECEKAEVSFESTFERRPFHAPMDAPGAGDRGHTREHGSPLYGARPITTAGCAKSAHGCVTCVTIDTFVSKKRTQKRTRKRTRVRWTAFPVTGLKSVAPRPPPLPFPPAGMREGCWKKHQ